MIPKGKNKMSNLVSALDKATDSNGIAVIEDIGLQGMITLRGDLSSAAVKKAATSVTGVEMPAQNMANHDGASGICWMSTDELLILCPYDDVTDTLAKMHKALGKTHSLAVDVSDARGCLRVSGPNAREVMAKLAPVDLSVNAFTVGMFRRTRLAQVAAAFWMVDAQTFQIVCFRSNAQYVFDLLKVAAQAGSEVGYIK
jgi:sarcosine oxidase subunit gamma